ncbi:alanine--tRNA ligase [Haliovirga abyssi]|uniref:Alanine--tRNA ligase n=1 Tax=Haliovirga abyssi TaxID=2996794 RepID=A0AAU9DH27_9FUSO|nr:alanine--tRNA ligase [Haliovirga abyssi]BDU50782.1 alanine--tRNA ligase [Haliovirga abyssi]
MFTGNEIRKKFLDFFEQKMHKKYESASLVPDDPTMLLTIAGMVPFKPFFMGKQVPTYKRATSCQKCIRTNDLENVGRTARHQTFFEMLGNFSFGDYFKEEAIVWAWEFITEELKLSKDKLWISVYKDDEESIKIWNEKAGVSLDRIVKMDEDNFWSAGPTGSCGPSSEIYVDLGEDKGCDSPTCGVGCDCDRYIEIWNLVFTEYNRLEDGTLEPLPKKNIDTGMGLERITSVIQNVSSNFDTDLLKPLVEEVAKATGVKYNEKENIDFSLRVIADHIRAVTFLIGDGVLPSNDGRGYVLRRILRRAARHGRLLGYKKSFLYELSDKVIDMMGEFYPEIVKNSDHIKKVISIEEEKFEATLDQGIILTNNEIKKLKLEKKDKMNSEIVFKLYDTYGFPFELTEEICQENNIKIVYDEFKEKMEEQKNRARNSREVIKEKIEDSFIEEFYKENGKTEFLGYENLKLEGKVLHKKDIDTETYEVIFDKTPFYAESGGQIADSGIIKNRTFKGKVLNVQKRKDIFIHIVKIIEGNLKIGDNLTLNVDKEKREAVTKNHTATHLLQAALQEVIGKHVHQAGSYVNRERLRFDFSHYESIKKEEIEEIERIVNREILKNHKVDISLKNIDEAKKMGAMALFGDKYGDVVRVVKISDFSIELCGGTHVNSTGEIGLFKIVTETGIAAGTRRIEAITGLNSLEYLTKLEDRTEDLAEILKVDKDKLEEKANKLLDENRELKKNISELNSKLASIEADKFLENPEMINGINVIIKAFKGQNPQNLRKMADKAKDKLKSCVVVFGTNNGKAIFLVSVTKDLIEKGIKAGDIVREVAKIAEGNGGGRPDFAQAGGKAGNKVQEALNFAKKLLEEKL